MTRRLTIILDGRSVDVSLSSTNSDSVPVHVIGDNAKYYAEKLAQGYSFGFGTMKPRKKKKVTA